MIWRHSTGGARRNRFQQIAVYVHSTHVLLAVGTVLLPGLFFILEAQGWFPTLAVMVMSLLISGGASILVLSEFSPRHRLITGMPDLLSRKFIEAVVLGCALSIVILTPYDHPVSAASIALAWAFRALSGGSFGAGLFRLLILTVVCSLVLFVLDIVCNHNSDPIMVVVAALLALGVMGQDVMYALALEVDELRMRDAERAVITERKRFAGDLHDIQGQHLGLITVESELICKLIDRGDHEAAAHHAQRIQAITLEALEEMHRVVHANRQVSLRDEIANAAQVLRAAGITTKRDIFWLPVLDEAADRLLGLTVREAITNIIKHTQARTCSITCDDESRSGRRGILLTITDFGSDGSTKLVLGQRQAAGTGLARLKQRYRDRDGQLSFHSQNEGAQLIAWLPVDHNSMKRERL